MSQIKVNSIIPVSGVPTGGGGGIIQVKQTVKTDTASHSVAVGSVSGDVITASITPTSSTSKVLVMFSIYIGTPDEGGYGTFYRDGSAITAAIGDANSNRQRVSANTFVINDNRGNNINKIFSISDQNLKGMPFYDSFIDAREKYGPEKYFVWYNNWYSTEDKFDLMAEKIK